MKKNIFSSSYLLLFISITLSAQNYTDVHLQWKDSTDLESSIESPTGDLYNKLTHHGPAIENEWIGLRLYFDYKVAIDVYNKTKPQLELAAAGWYPTPEQQNEGWGSDQYKVGLTIGLGGIRLWDGNNPVFLNVVKKRTAKVSKEANISYMEMLSEGIPYLGDTIDVLVRVTVFSGIREAKVEAYALCDKPVQFLTGINYHPGTKTREGKNYICSWGLHPEDVAVFPLNIGAAIIYNPSDFSRIVKADTEYELISKPTKYLETWITSACEKEGSLNSMDRFIEYLNVWNK